MLQFWMGNLFLLLMILCSVASQVVLKTVLNETGPLGLKWSSVEALCLPSRFGRMVAFGALLGLALLLWVLSLSRLDISYAYPVACSSTLLITLTSVLFLGETVSARVWLGTVCIMLGVSLLSPGAGPQRSQPASGAALSHAAEAGAEAASGRTSGSR